MKIRKDTTDVDFEVWKHTEKYQLLWRQFQIDQSEGHGGGGITSGQSRTLIVLHRGQTLEKMAKTTTTLDKLVRFLKVETIFN